MLPPCPAAPLAALVTLCLACMLLASPIAGPYRVIIEHIIPCPESLVDIPFWVKVRLVRHRRDPSVFSIFANYTTHFLWTEEKDATFASWSSRGGWIDNGLIMRVPNVCGWVYKYFPSFASKMMARTYGPNGNMANETCPYPPAHYYMHNMSTDLVKAAPSVPMMFYGKWRVDGRIIEEPQPRRIRGLGCVRIFASVLPKLGVAKP